MQLMAVVGSFTAGEMALSAISTICKTPILHILLQGSGRAEVERVDQVGALFDRKTTVFRDRQQRDALRNEMAHAPQDLHFDAIGLGHGEQALPIDEADVAGLPAEDRSVPYDWSSRQAHPADHTGGATA